VCSWEVFLRLKAQEEFRDIPVVVVTAKSQDTDKALEL